MVLRYSQGTTRKSEVPGPDPLLEAALRGELDEAQAQLLAQRGPEAVTIMLLALAKRIAELNGRRNASSAGPSTPSGMIPVYEKPPASKRRKRPGAKRGMPARGVPDRPRSIGARSIV